jgi:outer membrane lipoprotein-sorting protein
MVLRISKREIMKFDFGGKRTGRKVLKHASACAVLAVMAAFHLAGAHAWGKASASNPPALPALPALPAAKKAPASPESSIAASGGEMKAATDREIKTLKDLDQKYQGTKPVAMKVSKTLKIGLLGEERTSQGTLWMSKGQLRMELEGDEKSLLVVNKKSLWAVTYPGKEFPDAPVQVIKGDAVNGKTRGQSVVGMLTLGGFLKIFNATSVQIMPSGEKKYFLSPRNQQSGFQRAQVTISADASRIVELKYWDERENETHFEFRDVTFGKNQAFGKKIEDSLFQYQPPANAEIMTL